MSNNLDSLLLCYHEYFGTFNSTNRPLNSVENKNYFRNILGVGKFLWPVQETFCVLSVIVSSVNVFVLTRPSMKSSSFNQLLVVLECVNVTSALAQLYFFFIYIYFGFLTSSYVIFYSQYVAITIEENSVFLTNWLTVLIGVWRLVAVVNPLKALHILTKHKAIVIFIVLVLNSCAHMSYEFASYRVEKGFVEVCSDEDHTNATVKSFYYFGDTSWSSKNYELFWNIEAVFLVLNSVIPPILFAGVSACLVWNISRIRSRRQGLHEGQKLTDECCVRSNVILVLYLWMFLGSSLYFFSSQLNWVIKREESHDPVAVSVLFLPNSISNCTSFLVYYFMCSKYRSTCKKWFCGWARTKSTKETTQPGNAE